MAARTPKNNKSNSKKKRSYTSKTQKQKNAQKSLIKDEIILIVTFVLSILLILSNFNLSGKVGKAINEITFGLIGFLGYLMPIILFWVIVFLIANKGNKVVYMKTLSFVILIVMMASLIQLISSNQTAPTIVSYYKTSSINKSGGGVIGGAIVNLIHPLFGTVGGYVIIIGIILICLLFLTGKTLFVYLGKKSRNSISEFREGQKQSRLQASKESSARSGRNNTKTQSQNSALGNDSKPRTFLLKDKFLNLTSKKKQEDLKLDSSTKDGKPLEKQGQQVFSMEEINGFDNSDTKDIDIPIHRSQSYEDDIVEQASQTLSKGLDKTHSNEYEGLKGQEELKMQENLNDQDLALLMEEQKLPEDQELSDEAIGRISKDVQSRNNKLKSGDIEELRLDQTIIEEKEYILPSVNMLAKPVRQTKVVPDKVLKETALKLQETLESFGVGVTVNNVSCGPTVTRYELQPEQGVKVSKITSLADDIKLNLAASDIRIEAPIPGKAAVGIEIPNKENSIVSFREMVESKEFTNHKSKLAFAVGKDIGGRNIIADIAKMPHLLIAGATGSGKSVCINTIIMSVLYNSKPSEVRFIMIDPKVVELSVYNGIPHLLLPVVTDPKKAASALNWGVNEMTIRYKKFADLGVRDLKSYNEKVKNDKTIGEEHERLTQIIIVVDELADLMMVASTEVEDAICRLAQMARAAGIHLIIATQRPSVNVITGVIKANIPSRIAFSVSSAVDSRTILDGSGAEKLLGKGDMLYYPSGYSKPLRVQGAFISDKEITKVVDFITKKNGQASYDKKVEQEIISTQSSTSSVEDNYLERDEYFVEAGRVIIEKDKASIGMLQRIFRIGFNRAARIMDQLHHAGTVGPEEGTKPRQILMTEEEFSQYLQDNDIF